MSEENGEHPEITTNLGRRIDQLERKVDLVAVKQEHILEKMQSGFDLQAAKQDGHWRTVEQQFEHGMREQAQSIKFLTDLAKENRTSLSRVEERVDAQGDKLIVVEGRVDEQDKRISSISSNLQKGLWLFAAQLLGTIGAVVVFLVTRG